MAAATVLLALVVPAASANAGVIPQPMWPRVMVADDHGHVYLASSGGPITVHDRTGALLTTLEAGRLVDQLVLSSDGSQLIASGGSVAEPFIDVIDTTTATLVQSVALPATQCAGALAATSGRVWFGTHDCANSVEPTPTTLRTVSTSGGSITDAGGPAMTQPALYPWPGHPDRLVAIEGTSLRTLDVSGSSVTQRSSATLPSHPTLALPDADGTGFDLAFGGALQEWDLDTLSLTHTYDALPVPAGAASTSGSGGALAIAPTNGPVQIFRGDHLLRTLTSLLSSWPSMAWSPDGSVLVGWDSPWDRVDILEGATRTVSTLTVAGPTSVLRAHSLAVTGRLLSDGAPVAGATVTISRTDSSGTRAIGVARTDSTGAWHLGDKPPRQGYTTYLASYAGSTAAAPVTTRSAKVRVIGSTPVLTLTTAASVYTYGSRATAVIHLGPTYTNRSVTLTVAPYKAKATVLGPFRVNSAGNVLVPVTIRSRTTLTARFAGDAVYNARAVARTLLSTTRLYLVVVSPYTKVGSALRVKAPTVAMRVVRYPGQNLCALWDIQRKRGSSWVAEGPSSRICQTALTYTRITELVAGQTYRVRARFAGDAWSLAATTPWVTLVAVR